MTNYPDHPGHRGQDTSKAAADLAAGNAGSIRHGCYFAIRDAGLSGLTTPEVEDRLGRRPEQRPLDPRISELRRKGLIVDSGRRRMGRCGVDVIVWVTSPQSPKQ